MRPPVALASRSTARRAVLENAGARFEAVESPIDEDAAKAELLERGETPTAIAAELADRKARAASAGRPGLVIGADQTLELDGRLCDKAASLDEARARLRALRGRTHLLHSAVAVARNGQVIWREMQSAALTMRSFSDAFLEAYLDSEGPAALGSVGCYRLEGMGAQLFSRIEGDYFAILGLPLMGLLDLLRREGALAE